MSSENNRVENEIKVWQSKEEKLKFLFQNSPQVERSFGIEKLKFFKMLLFKYKKTKAVDEKITLRFLKHEFNKLKHQVYPNIILRLLNEVLSSVVFERIDKQDYLKDLELNKKTLEEQLIKSGFHVAYGKVLEHMQEQQLNFSITVSYHISENERLEHSLQFVKDSQGAYQFDGFRSILYTDSSPSRRCTHYFKNEKTEGFSAAEAYEMLAGRAVLKVGTWKQFNFNDRDLNDNYRIHEFPESYGYNLSEALRAVPLKNDDYETFESLADSLKKGRREEVLLMIQGREMKVFLEANPRFKTLNFYNDRMQKLSLAEIKNGCKISPLLKPQQNIESQTAKKSHHV
ncbi:hypothetical protein P0R33_07040 [Flavobacterium sp. YJ01]|uniref:hypothetical protein n=1 Tax=Flavobacterium sp. YJ01 TaxID=3031997 RepID=UPI0023E40923|nr:hypothetical protein [Flavobacterium sp. YJ01]WET04090.1 hypothetical protein P0R33_07040 [Flavobacterium sp. YJ01]